MRERLRVRYKGRHVHAHTCTHTHTACTRTCIPTQTHTYTQTQPLVLPLHSLRQANVITGVIILISASSCREPIACCSNSTPKLSVFTSLFVLPKSHLETLSPSLACQVEAVVKIEPITYQIRQSYPCFLTCYNGFCRRGLLMCTILQHRELPQRTELNQKMAQRAKYFVIIRNLQSED